MKYVLFMIGLYISLYAQTMTPEQHMNLHTYNKRPSLQKSVDKRAHQMHKIDDKQAMAIAKKMCKDERVTLRLTHRDTYLYYIAKTATCTLYINAIDGSIIDFKSSKRRAK